MIARLWHVGYIPCHIYTRLRSVSPHHQLLSIAPFFSVLNKHIFNTEIETSQQYMA